MTLAVRNSTPNTVYIVVGYPNDGCNNPSRGKRGWYVARPGRTVTIYGGRVARDQFFWYAEDDAGHVWSGSENGFNQTAVPEDAFDMCWIENCPAPRCRRLAFRSIYFGSFFQSDYTINLVLSSSQKKTNSRTIRIALPTKRRVKNLKHRHGIINKSKRKTIPKR